MSEHQSIYIDEIYQTITLDPRTDIRVVTTERIVPENKELNSLLVDIRKYKLYGNNYDDLKKATNKGIRFRLENIRFVIFGLLDILVHHDMLSEDKCNQIKELLE